MICFIYRSPKKAEMYLYTLTRDNFTKIPESLLKVFGHPEFSMTINIGKRDVLARADIEQVKQHLMEEGYYLQMPPTIYNDQNYLEPEEN